MIFPIHSIIDIITNSSQESFVVCENDSVEHIKAFINEILKCGGCSKTADDLFNIRLYMDTILDEDSNEFRDVPRKYLNFQHYNGPIFVEIIPKDSTDSSDLAAHIYKAFSGEEWSTE